MVRYGIPNYTPGGRRCAGDKVHSGTSITYRMIKFAEPSQSYAHTRPAKAARSVRNREALVSHIGPLFRATHSLEYYPVSWATTETLVLKKLGKADYTVPSAWRPIVLSDGLARLLNGCMAADLVNMFEKLNILPANHFGALFRSDAQYSSLFTWT